MCVCVCGGGGGGSNKLKLQHPSIKNVFLIDPNTIMDNNAILLERWRLLTLIPVINPENKRQCLEWLSQRRLIKNNMACELCEGRCTLTLYQQGIDGYRWKCNACNFVLSVCNRFLFYQE